MNTSAPVLPNAFKCPCSREELNPEFNMVYESFLFQINLGKRRAASYDLQLRTQSLGRFIVLAQEPWMVRGRPAGLNPQHRKLVAACDDDHPARALIYCHKDAEVAPCPAFTGRDVACGLWDVGMPNLPQVMLISLYWDGRFPSLPQKFLECLKECAEKGIPVHVGGDFNAHQVLWGGRRDTARGNLVQNLMIDYNLVLLNEGDVSTFVNANGSSVIDLTMASPECMEYISSWGVIVKDRKPNGESYNGSDHRTIETRYISRPPEKMFRRSMKDVDWKLFRSNLSERMRNWAIPRTMTRNELDGYVEEWIRLVSVVCDEFSKLQVVVPRNPVINLWFTKELRDERYAVSCLGRIAVRSKDPLDWDRFHEAGRVYSHNLRKAARSCFQKYTNEIPDMVEMARFC